MAIALKLPILGEAMERYKATLHRDLRGRVRLSDLRSEQVERSEIPQSGALPNQLSDQDFFDLLDLNAPGLGWVKSEFANGNLEGAKSAYVSFLRQRAERWDDGTVVDVQIDESRNTQYAILPPDRTIWTKGRNTHHAPIHHSPLTTHHSPLTFDTAKSCLERARYLAAHQSHEANGFKETCEIGISALLFPEWRDGKQLLKLALRRYKWIIDTHFFPDGFHTDCSSTSHYLAFTGLSSFYRLAKLTHPHLLQDFDNPFERLIEAFMYLSQPDYHLPLLGDCHPSDVHVSEPCRAGYECFNRRADFQYMATAGAAGGPPNKTSHAFSYAGYYVMRDNWHSDAQYLVFDGGCFGAGHPHEDKLNFSLYAHGRPLIIDPGDDQTSDAFGDYFRSSRGHNSLMIDGKGQCRALMADEEIIPDPDTRWMTTPSFDFVEGWYKEAWEQDGGREEQDGWREGKEGGKDGRKGRMGTQPSVLPFFHSFQHKRSIFYVKGAPPRSPIGEESQTNGPLHGAYFILHDLVLGEGEHLLEQIFHLAPVLDIANERFHPGRVEIIEDKVVRTVEPNVSNIAIVPVNPAPLDVRLQCGETDPVVGWTALAGKTPSYDLTYTAKRSLPTVMNTVLFPLHSGAETVPVVKSIEVVTDPDVLGTGFTVAHGRFIDLVLISDDGFATMLASPPGRGAGGESNTPVIEFTGEYLFLRLDAQGAPHWAAMIQGQFLKVNGRVWVALPEPREVYAVSWGHGPC
ncbi:alginate lyase family protein [Candidatus Poribacteria bacterium]|nr:alginate lyase family protein [Candidatus Poribacteria bacterium]